MTSQILKRETLLDSVACMSWAVVLNMTEWRRTGTGSARMFFMKLNDYQTGQLTELVAHPIIIEPENRHAKEHLASLERIASVTNATHQKAEYHDD